MPRIQLKSSSFLRFTEADFCLPLTSSIFISSGYISTPRDGRGLPIRIGQSQTRFGAFGLISDPLDFNPDWESQHPLLPTRSVLSAFTRFGSQRPLNTWRTMLLTSMPLHSPTWISSSLIKSYSTLHNLSHLSIAHRRSRPSKLPMLCMEWSR
jgi:hypothetical protein